MNKVSVVGLGMSYADLTEQHLSIIRQSDVLVGGNRHLAYFSDFPGEKRTISDNLTDIARYIQDHYATQRITVIASGDPLFYGIGSYLAKKLGKDNIQVYPNISSVAAAFARIGEAWQEAALISLHGRSLTRTHMEQLRTCQKAAVLTDGTHSPAWVWAELKKNGIEGFKPVVLSRLGEADEQITRFSGDDILTEGFSEPNILILLRETSLSEEDLQKGGIGFGLDEACFVHEKGLITKPEVRAVSLSKLKLAPHHVLWDLGAGSGSVSIEASGFIRTGQIIAVEKNPERIKDIQANKDRFCVDNLAIVQADLPDGMDNLPAPDRVFIGGGGKNIAQIISASARQMIPGGIMVVNTVLLDSVSAAMDTLEKLKFTTQIVQVQVNFGHRMPESLMFKGQNPVFIISGEKQ